MKERKKRAHVQHAMPDDGADYWKNDEDEQSCRWCMRVIDVMARSHSLARYPTIKEGREAKSPLLPLAAAPPSPGGRIEERWEERREEGALLAFADHDA